MLSKLHVQVFAGASFYSWITFVFIFSDGVPLVGFAQVICSITAQEAISRKLLGKFPVAAKMHYLVDEVLFSWERRLSIWIVGNPVLLAVRG